MDVSAILYGASIWVLPLLFAITFHEAAHGYVAWRLGDDTTKNMGRVTFNPLRHIDRFGTVILPVVFGYAKPVPVNFQRVNRPRRDMVWVAVAGPATNIALALASGFLFHLAGAMPAFVGEWLGHNLGN